MRKKRSAVRQGSPDVTRTYKSEGTPPKAPQPGGATEISSETIGERARNAIIQSGYTIDEATQPYKSFGPHDRFYIQKCFDKNGAAVVVKIAAPEEHPLTAIQREIRLDSIVRAAVLRAQDTDARPETHFTEKIGEINDGDMRGIVTAFVHDDKDAKSRLTHPERLAILQRVAHDLQQLDVPAELTHQEEPYWQQEVQLKNGDAHTGLASYFLQEIRHAPVQNKEKGYLLSDDEENKIIQLFLRHQKLIDSFPLKFSHGDIHGENIAFEQAQNGERRVTLMDLEALCVDNEFTDWAILANRAAFAGRIPSYGDELNDFAQLIKKTWIDTESKPLEESIEAHIVRTHERPRDAEIVYRLMRIENCLDRIAGSSKNNDRVSQIIVQMTLEILREQLEKISPGV